MLCFVATRCGHGDIDPTQFLTETNHAAITVNVPKTPKYRNHSIDTCNRLTEPKVRYRYRFKSRLDLQKKLESPLLDHKNTLIYVTVQCWSFKLPKEVLKKYFWMNTQSLCNWINNRFLCIIYFCSRREGHI